MTILLQNKVLKILSCIFACVLFASNAFATNYNVTYDCGFYTGTPPAPTTATYGASFTPASTANNCGQMNGATLTGWLVSGTNDVKPYNASFTWEYDEDKTLTAVWSCYPNIEGTACVQGYKITLSIFNSSCRPPMYPMEPTVLYTIPTRGAYLDQARTLLMTKTDNPIQLPHVEFILSFDTNAPQNPEDGTQYNVNSVPPVNLGNYRYSCIAHPQIGGGIYTGHGWTSGVTCFIHNNPDNYTNMQITGLTPTNRDGYLTDAGIYEAENQYTNQSWYINGCGWSTLPYINSPSLTGYTFVNWCTDTAGTTACFNGQVPNNVQNHIYYGHWVPKTYNVVYNKGAHASSGSADYTDTNGATFDSPYTPLSFASAPISNNMSADTGYVFAGWTTDPSPTFTNGTLDNQYTGDTWWKRTSALNLYAAYDCDTANGYAWNNEHTACVRPTYNVTYYSGNCSLGHATDSFDTTYSTTDSTHPATGDTYTILMGSTNPDLSTVFQSINGFTYPDSNYTGEGTSCVGFTYWQDANSNTYGWNPSDPNAAPPSISPYGSDDMNLYAVCTWIPIEVGYYPGTCGGNGDIEEVGIYGTSFNMPTAAAEGISVPSGYTFQGWSLSPAATTVDYAVGDSYTPGVCISTVGKDDPYYKFYAVCTQSEYSISYTSNITPNEGVPSPQTNLDINDTETLASALTATGYNFIGWMCDYDINTGAHVNTGYIADTSVTFNCSNNVICEAVWQSTSCDQGQTLIQMYLGGLGSDELSPILDNSGKTDDSGTSVQFGGAENSVEFGTKCGENAGIPFAHGEPGDSGHYCWCQITNYTIDGHTESVSSAPWVFVEYFYDSGECEHKCQDACGEALAGKYDMRAAAYSSYVCAYEISYNLGQPSSATSTTTPDSSFVVYGETYYLADAPIAETGWNFKGWSCPNLTGTTQSNGFFAGGANGTYSYAGNVECTAQWECANGYEMNTDGQCIRYTITFISSQVTPSGGLPPTMYVINGGTYNLPPALTAYGYNFVAWWCDYDLNTGVHNTGTDHTVASQGSYLANAQFTFSGTHNVTCDALWNSGLYTLTYYATVPTGVTFANIPSDATINFGTGTTTYSYEDTNVSAYDEETEHIVRPLPSAYGYYCPKWSCRTIVTGQNQTSQIIGADFDFDLNNYYVNMQFSDAFCETTCVPNTVHLEWDSDGGASVSTPTSCSYGETNGINGIIQPTKTGYVFDGWLLTGWKCDLSDQGIDKNKQGITNASASGNSWSMTFDYGVFQGTSLCSSLSGDYNINWEAGYSSFWKKEYSALATSSGNNCWCKLTSFNQPNQPQCDITSDYYMFLDNISTCSTSCATACSNAMKSRYQFRYAIISIAQ